MFYSFILKLKLIEKNQDEIEKYVNYEDFSKEFFSDKSVSVSNFLTKDKKFELGKIYLIKITSLNSGMTTEIFKNIFSKRIENIPISFQKNIFMIKDIIHNPENNSYAGQLLEKDLLELDDIYEVTLKFITPALFKVGDEFFSTPDSKLIFSDLLRRFNRSFESLEMDNALSKVSNKVFENIEIQKCSLRSSDILVKKKKYRGFTGEVTYRIKNRDTENIGKLLDCLTKFSFYSGVGYLTQWGTGQVTVVERKNREEGCLSW